MRFLLIINHWLHWVRGYQSLFAVHRLRNSDGLTPGAAYGARNVLEDPELREAIKEYTAWPTIPQVFLDGEFVGGCDIVKQLADSGELGEMLKKSGVIA